MGPPLLRVITLGVSLVVTQGGDITTAALGEKQARSTAHHPYIIPYTAVGGSGTHLIPGESRLGSGAGDATGGGPAAKSTGNQYWGRSCGQSQYGRHHGQPILAVGSCQHVAGERPHSHRRAQIEARDVQLLEAV